MPIHRLPSVAQDTHVGGMFGKFWCQGTEGAPLLLILTAPGGALGAADRAHTGSGPLLYQALT